MLLNQIKLTKTNNGKSNMTSGDAYRITLSYKGKRRSFAFHDNYENSSTKAEILDCLLLDAEAYNNARDFEDFCSSFGWDTDSIKALKAFKGCKKNAEKVNALFTLEEVHALFKEISAYYENN